MTFRIDYQDALKKSGFETPRLRSQKIWRRHRFEPLEMPEGYGSVVFKDGFQYVGCMQDEMEQIADPVGENKFSYSDYANFTNVSITRYARLPIRRVRDGILAKFGHNCSNN